MTSKRLAFDRKLQAALTPGQLVDAYDLRDGACVERGATLVGSHDVDVPGIGLCVYATIDTGSMQLSVPLRCLTPHNFGRAKP